jgi:hypothetical protein
VSKLLVCCTETLCCVSTARHISRGGVLCQGDGCELSCDLYSSCN